MHTDRSKPQTDAQDSRREGRAATPETQPAQLTIPAMDVGFFDELAFDDAPTGPASA